jgi:branched-chain amino acid transport system permease protein
LNYEIVTAEALSDYNSGIVILMAFVGGIGNFYGPMIGAVLVTVLQVAVASVTPAWPFYFGLFFLIIVLYAPGGIASLFVRHQPVWQASLFHRLVPAYLLALGPALMVVFGVVAAVEMAYARNPDRVDAQLHLAGVPLDGASLASWLAVVVVLVLGWFLLRLTGKVVSARWDAVHEAMK